MIFSNGWNKRKLKEVITIKNKVFVIGDTTVIEIYSKNYKRHFYTLIDTEDLERIESIVARTISVGVGEFTNYCQFLDKNTMKTISLHRFVMNTPKGLVVDHLNFNGLDNRKKNLRNCTSGENNLLSRKRAIKNPIYETWSKYGFKAGKLL